MSNSTVTSLGNWREFDDLELTPILTGALDAFYEHGFHGTTVRDIARRVGVTVPALYYHFENKEAVFLALLSLSTEDISWRVAEAIAEAGDDDALALALVTEAVVRQMTLRHKLAALDPESRYLNRGNRERYAATRRPVEDAVIAVVGRGIAAGTFSTIEPREAARALLGMWQFIARWYREDGGLTSSEITDRYVQLSLALVGHRD